MFLELAHMTVLPLLRERVQLSQQQHDQLLSLLQRTYLAQELTSTRKETGMLYKYIVCMPCLLSLELKMRLCSVRRFLLCACSTTNCTTCSETLTRVSSSAVKDAARYT